MPKQPLNLKRKNSTFSFLFLLDHGIFYTVFTIFITFVARVILLQMFNIKLISTIDILSQL